MKEPTRRTLIAGGLAALVAPPARAQSDWPDRPVTMVHGFPPGGTVDLVARIVADGLSRRIGQPVVVEGRTGASGTTAAAASRAPRLTATRCLRFRPDTSSWPRPSRACPIGRSKTSAPSA